jgi:hypothetical protein
MIDIPLLFKKMEENDSINTLKSFKIHAVLKIVVALPGDSSFDVIGNYIMRKATLLARSDEMTKHLDYLNETV